jgi:hypothetical protein
MTAVRRIFIFLYFKFETSQERRSLHHRMMFIGGFYTVDVPEKRKEVKYAGWTRLK